MDRQESESARSLGVARTPDKILRIDPLTWLAGFVAGEAGQPSHHGLAEQDSYSWHAGWIEGNAKRHGYEYSLGALTPADVDEYKARTSG